MDLKEGYFTTSDGCRLHTIEVGTGRPLLMIPGWRNIIPSIDLPTLVIGSAIKGADGQRWIGRQIRGARVEIFAEEEGGSHFMFMENPEMFNQIVRDFMAG